MRETSRHFEKRIFEHVSYVQAFHWLTQKKKIYPKGRVQTSQCYPLKLSSFLVYSDSGKLLSLSKCFDARGLQLTTRLKTYFWVQNYSPDLSA